MVLIHGFCEHSEMWADIEPYFDDNYRLHRIDLPGFGTAADREVLSMEEAAVYVHTLLKKQGVDSYVVGGHSMGGYVGLEMRRQFPESVRGLSLINSHTAADTALKRENRIKTIEFLTKHGKADFLKVFVKDLLSARNDHRTDWHAELFEMVDLSPLKSIIQALRYMSQRRDFSEDTMDWDCPVQFLIGREDKLYHYPETLGLAARCAHADIHLFDSGHLGIKEMPESYAERISSFVHYAFGYTT